MITLSLLHPIHKTPVQSWTFEDKSIIRIGRSASNDVVLYSAVVSRHHIEIHRLQVGWELKNLGTNGTYLDGRRITQVSITNGTTIRLARSGPIIQIHTSEDMPDPLKQLLSDLSEREARRASLAAASDLSQQAPTSAEPAQTEEFE